ncbi:MAG: sedoheptulose 7-phosphate cyclase [Myxococcota bacterium]
MSLNQPSIPIHQRNRQPSPVGDYNGHGVDEKYRTSRWYGGGGEITADDRARSFTINATFAVESEARVVNGVFDPSNTFLADYYREFRRCVIVIDQTVNDIYGANIRAYLNHHQLAHQVLSLRAWEEDKNPSTVDAILDFFRQNKVSRHEPVLVIGGGVLADTAGLAAALHHRRTPYVMIGTTLISAIDAGPSPRTCVNGDGFKNHMGAFHLPALTLIDRAFLRTVAPGHLRHGMAEVMKMAFVDDHALYQLIAEHGPRLLATQFATTENDELLSQIADEVIYRALKSYMSHEGSNPWEVHQARPHAYGHTWSPGYELPAGMLHGHAVSSGMSLGAVIASEMGWLDAGQRDAIIGLCSRLGLTVYHPVMTDFDLIHRAQVKMVEKRGGTLWAPLPKGTIGTCDYVEDVSASLLRSALSGLRDIAEDLPRRGQGVEMHLADLGMR